MTAPIRKPIEAMSTDELVVALGDPYWRLRNLYWITDKEGKAVLFQPWPEQQKFYDNIWYRNVIPKARQRGFSTAVQIMMLDACLWVPNTHAAIIAQDDQTAKAIFDTKIRFAWERMPAVVQQMVGSRKDNEHEMKWGNDSSIRVATSTRGGTLQYLHVSEFGIICKKNPGHAAEIMEGALPSLATHGVGVVESTVETPDGPFSDMVRNAEKLQIAGRELTPLDWKLHFASWWDAPEYEIDPRLVPLSSEDNAYFYRIEADLRRAVSPRKRAWYVKTRDETFGGDREKMFRQYPSTLREAFSVATEGRWLATQMARARHDGRIMRLPVMPGVPVNSFWDLGVTTDANCVWLHQKVGPWDHFVGFRETLGEPYSAIVRLMQEFAAKHGCVWGTHYLPHDGDQTRPGSTALKTPRVMLGDLGLKNIEIVPRISEVEIGIGQMREDFATYRFDEAECKDGIVHLDGYAKKWNGAMATWSTLVAENGHQHAADALRQKAQWAHNMRMGGSNPHRRRNNRGMAA